MAVVIAVHLIFICFLMKGKKAETEDVGGKQTEENVSPVENTSLAPVSETVSGTPESASVSVAAPVVLPLYTDNYFDVQQVQIPAALQKQIDNSGVRGGIAVDLNTHKAYWTKEPFKAWPIASVTKMMTAFLAVEKMHASNGAITPDSMIKVTKSAAKIGARQVWLDPRESFTFTEIMKCIMVHSANDCAQLMAEFMCNGDAYAFVNDMNKRAAELGCKRFNFINPHGLTEGKEENSAAAAELAYLAEVLLGIPEITRWSNVKTEYLRENDEAYKAKNKGQATMLSSSNSLLGTCPGVNGMKTGFTNNARHCIVITCERNDRKTCVVLLGCKDRHVRDKLGAAMLDWLYSIRSN